MNSCRPQWSKLNLWSTPLVYASVTVFVGMTFPRLEHQWFPTLVSSMSAAAAMAIASSIASGMIALTGIVFSLSFVMVQFSATAYSPRLVLWVARDPVLAHSLGVFISTFFYALVMLVWVDRNSAGTVPLISGWMVIVLLLVSMGMFVALIERLGLLQINRMLTFTGDKGRKAIEEWYSLPRSTLSLEKLGRCREKGATQALTHRGPPRTLQSVDVDGLVRLAAEAGAVVELVPAVGDTIVEMMPLLKVYGGHGRLEEETLSNAMQLGEERTFEQDPKYALRLVVDIAIKALSPAVNDPTTAVQALDQIEDLLLRLGRCRLEVKGVCDQTGEIRLVLPFPSWDDFLLLALDEIRLYGAGSVQVMRRMNALIKNLMTVLPVERHAALLHWEDRLSGSIERSFADAEEKKDASVADRQGIGIGQPESAGS